MYAFSVIQVTINIKSFFLVPECKHRLFSASLPKELVFLLSVV